MKLCLKQAAFTENVAKLIQYINQKGNTCTFGETYRPQETAEIYASMGKGIFKSLHTERLAVDLNLFTKSGEYLTTGDSYAPYGNYWESLHPNNKWGGNFKTQNSGDYNHFEMKP